MADFNPRSPCGERRHGLAVHLGEVNISIHAPRVGSDCLRSSSRTYRAYFNPRSPCGERRPQSSSCPTTLRFQSTLPVWGATAWQHRAKPVNGFQSTLPVWGATLDQMHTEFGLSEFQSTLPVWGATRKHHRGQRQQHISIHAPRVGSDLGLGGLAADHRAFQSTLPVWGATVSDDFIERDAVFQSTLPVWGATAVVVSQNVPDVISIHAPRVGSDLVMRSLRKAYLYFNPRSPCGERLGELVLGAVPIEISIHAPRVGSDRQGQGAYQRGRGISIHAPRVGSDSR